MGKIPLVYWWDELAMRELVCAGAYPPLGSPNPAAQVPRCPYYLGLPPHPAGPQPPPADPALPHRHPDGPGEGVCELFMLYSLPSLT